MSSNDVLCSRTLLGKSKYPASIVNIFTYVVDNDAIFDAICADDTKRRACVDHVFFRVPSQGARQVFYFWALENFPYRKVSCNNRGGVCIDGITYYPVLVRRMLSCLRGKKIFVDYKQ